MANKNYGILMSLGLAGVALGIWADLSSIWTVEQNWETLLSSTGVIAITFYVLLLLIGLFILIAGAWNMDGLHRTAGNFRTSLLVRWLIITGLLLVFTYIYLFSPWQTVLALAWPQALFAMGLAQVILLLAGPERKQRFGWSELAVAVGLFLYPRVIQEIRALFTDATIYRAATAAGFIILLGLIFVLYANYGERLRFGLMAWRDSLGSARWGIVALLGLIPLFHRYLVRPETYVQYNDIRFLIVVIALWWMAYLGLAGSTRVVSRESLGLSLGVLMVTSFLAWSSLLI